MDFDEIATSLATDPAKGLQQNEVTLRRAKYGPNLLQTIKKAHWYEVLARQFVSVLIIILFVAAAIALAVAIVPEGR